MGVVMRLEDVMSYARLCQEASDLPPGTAASVVPLIITDEQLDELRDGTDLTREQWLQVAYHGIILWPHEIALPTE